MNVADAAIVGGVPELTPAQCLAYLSTAPERGLSDAEIGAIVGAAFDYGARFGIRGDVAFAQLCHETNRFRFGGQVRPDQHNPAGIGATNDGAAGLVFDSWRAGILAYYVHLAAWVGGLVAVPAIAPFYTTKIDPRIPLVEAVRAAKGAASTWRELGGRWAVPGVGYGDAIARHFAAILALAPQGVSTMLPALDQRLIAALRAQGLTVTDLYGQLPVNAAYPYGQIDGGPGGVRQLAVHYTGDRFTAATLHTITGSDGDGSGAIPPTLTPQQEIDLLTWYANYHISKDNGTWGGIAYVILILPSGRVYWTWPIGTLTYHAYNANASALAICCPIANDVAPTPQQAAALYAVLDVLCWHAPEIVAGAADVWGHQELTFIDPRNVTACPGKVLPLAQQYRAERREQAAPVTPAPDVAPQAAPVNPHAQEIAVPGTGRSYWVIDPILSYWRDNGGLVAFGYPWSGLFTDSAGTVVQYFERARLEVQPDGATVARGRVGAELAALVGIAQ